MAHALVREPAKRQERGGRRLAGPGAAAPAPIAAPRTTTTTTTTTTSTAPTTATAPAVAHIGGSDLVYDLPPSGWTLAAKGVDDNVVTYFGPRGGRVQLTLLQAGPLPDSRTGETDLANRRRVMLAGGQSLLSGPALLPDWRFSVSMRWLADDGRGPADGYFASRRVEGRGIQITVDNVAAASTRPASRRVPLDPDDVERNVAVGQAMAASVRSESGPPTWAETVITTLPHGWSLAAAALPTETSGRSHELLGEADRSPEATRAARQELEANWKVKSRGELLKMFEFIDAGGHRKGFDALIRQLTGFSETDLDQMFARAELDPATDHRALAQLKVARRYSRKLRGRGLFGWEYTNYISICRLGYRAEYLTPTEAWAKIVPAARRIQQRFDSWAELGENYIVGREYWDGDAPQSYAELREAYRRLLNSPQSPWSRFDWKADLGVVPVTLPTTRPSTTAATTRSSAPAARPPPKK